MDTVIEITQPEVAENVRALAELTGVSVTEAIGAAVKDRLDLERYRRRPKNIARAHQLIEEIWKLPVVGPTLTDDDLYDADGLPK